MLPALAVTLLAGASLLLPLPLAHEARATGMTGVLLAALLLLLGPLAGTGAVARLRPDDPGLRRAGRIVQALLVAPSSAGAAFAALRLAGAPVAASTPAAAAALAAAAVASALLLLFAERVLAAADPADLPEAPDLRRLALAGSVANLVAAAGIAAPAAGLPFGPLALRGAALVLAALAAELALRALLRLYLPPPLPAEARGAVHATLARLLAAALRTEPFARRLREASGLDFSRSWALGFLRAASPAFAVVLALLGWGMSGLVIVPLDGRAIDERFGAPVAVLGPGLHAILPWPLARARRVEYGTLHEFALGDAPATARSGAEAADPSEADRLWDRPHPGELTLLVASEARTADGDDRHRQLFQSVAADLRVIWRVGLAQADAIRATYATRDGPALLRALAGRAVAASLSGATLETVLGADREAMGDAIRARLQASLDRDRTGLEAVAVIVEAIHPPAGAADAYHAVRAAEIAARAAVFAERGRALAIRAQSRQFEFEQTAAAAAHAAEIDAEARNTAIRFAADRDAASLGRADYLFERYLADLAAAIGHSPLTIVDHRLWDAAAPTIDLRPLPGAAPTMSDGE